jgi:hypothetical protein
MPCKGSPKETCGGFWANLVYATSVAPPHSRTSALGCFKDQGDPSGTKGRDLDGDVLTQSNMSTELCVSTCQEKGFAYAGTQFGSWCFCGDQHGRSGASANCDMKCSGAPNEICGGAWANNVYATGVVPVPAVQERRREPRRGD